MTCIILPFFQTTVRVLLHEKIRDSYVHPQFIADVIKPLQIEPIMDQEVGGVKLYCGRGLCDAELFSFHFPAVRKLRSRREKRGLLLEKHNWYT